MNSVTWNIPNLVYVNGWKTRSVIRRDTCSYSNHVRVNTTANTTANTTVKTTVNNLLGNSRV